MPMNAGDALGGTGLAGAIYSSLVSANPAWAANPSNAAATQGLVNAIASGVVAHLKANMQVGGITAGVAVTAPGAVT